MRQGGSRPTPLLSHPPFTPRSVAVFDDIDRSAGMQQAWQRIAQDRVVSCSIDLGKFGVVACRDGHFTSPRHFKLAFPPERSC